MKNKKAKQMIESLTGANFGKVPVVSYWHGYRQAKLVYCLAKNNKPYPKAI